MIDFQQHSATKQELEAQLSSDRREVNKSEINFSAPCCSLQLTTPCPQYWTMAFHPLLFCCTPVVEGHKPTPRWLCYVHHKPLKSLRAARSGLHGWIQQSVPSSHLWIKRFLQFQIPLGCLEEALYLKNQWPILGGEQLRTNHLLPAAPITSRWTSMAPQNRLVTPGASKYSDGRHDWTINQPKKWVWCMVPGRYDCGLLRGLIWLILAYSILFTNSGLFTATLVEL